MYRSAPLLVLVLVCSLLAAPASGVVAPGVTNDVDPTPGPIATPAAALIGTPAGASTGATTMMDDAPADATDGPTAIERANRSLSVSTAKGSLEVHFVNVEEGIATLVVGPTGETMLVDSGGFGSEEHIQTYLGRQGVDRLDYLVASHAHGDHIAAHDSLVEHYETERNGVGVAYDSGLDRNTPVYRAYLDALAEHDVEHETLRRGDTVPLEGAEVTVLSPPERALADGDFNENSLVLLVEFGDASVLLTADAEDDAEAFLVDADVPAVTVLQVGKEGSDIASTPAFLDRTAPVVAVVHGGDERDFDRPNRTVLERLTARDVPTYWTEVHGATVLVSDGETIEVHAQSGATTEPLSLRDADSTLPSDTSPAERVGVIRDGVHQSTTDGNDGTATPSPTATPTPSPTATPTPSPTNSPTLSPTASLSPSPTVSPIPSPTGSPTPSPTPGAPPTATPSPVTSGGEGSPTATPTTTLPPSRFVAPLDRFVRATGVPFSVSLALFGIVAAAVLANRRR